MPPSCQVVHQQKARGCFHVEKLYLHRSFLHELYAAIKLTELMVAATRVRENLHAIQAHEDVGAT